MLLLLLILFMFIIYVCVHLFSRPIDLAPSTQCSLRPMEVSAGVEADELSDVFYVDSGYVGSRMAYSNPRKDRNVYQ